MITNDFYQAIFNHAQFGFALHEILFNEIGQVDDFRYINVNKAFEELSGRTRVELVGRTVGESFKHSREDILNWSAIYGKIGNEGVRHDFEVFSAKLKRWYRVFSFSPSEAHLITVFIDITFGKQALLDADDLLLKLSRAVEQSPASVVITNLQGEIEYVNPKFSTVTGYSFEEAKGQNPRILKSGSQSDEVYKDMWIKISAGLEWQGEFHNRTKDGTLYWESASISPIVGENGKVTHFLAVKEDITRRKEAEAEVEKSRAELRAIYDSAPVMMAVIDRQRNLVYANSAFTAFTGVPEKELIGGRACGVFGCINSFDNAKGCGFGPECSNCGLLKAIEDTFETGRTNKDVEYHTTLVTRAGIKDIWLLGATAPIVFADKQLLLLNFIDISDRRKAEAEILEKNAALSELNATKDRFFSIIAHDLRSPFSGILGFSELMLEQIQVKDYNGIEQYASNILKSSRRMMDLLTNLLEWARSQTGRIKFVPVDIDLESFIKEIVSIFDETSAKKSVTILTEIPHGLQISADAHMIGTVIRNLISNAVKFSTRGGEIVVNASDAPSEVVISVKDNGIAIEKSRLTKLFNPETNRATPGTDHEMGTGLGLILCKEFVEKHGGKIWAESPEREGTIFSFTLPLIRR